MTDTMTDNSMTALAQEIIQLRDRLKADQGTFRSQWQSVADNVFPQTFGIATKISPGQELMNNLFDTTAVEEAENMANGISNTLFPPGQRFFLIRADDGLDERDDVREYLPYLTKKAHEHIANSNFRMQVDNTLHYWVVFGMGSLYSQWTSARGLMYRDYAIGTYQCLEDETGVIDTIVLTLPMTARQIFREFGSNCGASVARALEKPETRHQEFDIIHVVRPRRDRDPQRIDNLNMAWESLYVQEKDQKVLDIGGYEEFPFAVPRYDVTYGEVYGRGRGVKLLPQIRTLNRIAKDFLEMCDKWVAPPLEVLESFEGEVDITPKALNYVTQLNSIAPINMGANGAFPATEKVLEYYREGIRQGFFKSAFEAITPLSGDRRTQLEIAERLKEGMKKLGKPIARLIDELLTPAVERSILLLIRNNVSGLRARMPAVLRNRPFRLQFIGPLAKALEEYEAKAAEYWVTTLGTAEGIFRGVTDNVDSDQWARDLGESLGVNPRHVRSQRKVREIRKARAAQEQMAAALQAAQTGADAYNRFTKAPEEGSPVAAGTGE